MKIRGTYCSLIIHEVKVLWKWEKRVFVEFFNTCSLPYIIWLQCLRMVWLHGTEALSTRSPSMGHLLEVCRRLFRNSGVVVLSTSFKLKNHSTIPCCLFSLLFCIPHLFFSLFVPTPFFSLNTLTPLCKSVKCAIIKPTQKWSFLSVFEFQTLEKEMIGPFQSGFQCWSIPLRLVVWE